MFLGIEHSITVLVKGTKVAWSKTYSYKNMNAEGDLNLPTTTQR